VAPPAPVSTLSLAMVRGNTASIDIGLCCVYKPDLTLANLSALTSVPARHLPLFNV